LMRPAAPPSAPSWEATRGSAFSFAWIAIGCRRRRKFRDGSSRIFSVFPPENKGFSWRLRPQFGDGAELHGQAKEGHQPLAGNRGLDPVIAFQRRAWRVSLFACNLGDLAELEGNFSGFDEIMHRLDPNAARAGEPRPADAPESGLFGDRLQIERSSRAPKSPASDNQPRPYPRKVLDPAHGA